MPFVTQFALTSSRAKYGNEQVERAGNEQAERERERKEIGR